MKQTLNTYLRVLPWESSVTLGLVEAVEIIGTLWSSATGAMANERLDATSPMSTVTLSFTTSRVAATCASSGLPWSSSVLSASFFPFTPPALFRSSRASRIPLSVESPKVASEPVSEAMWPMRIVSESLFVQPATMTRNNAAAASTERIPIPPQDRELKVLTCLGSGLSTRCSHRFLASPRGPCSPPGKQAAPRNGCRSALEKGSVPTRPPRGGGSLEVGRAAPAGARWR